VVDLNSDSALARPSTYRRLRSPLPGSFQIFPCAVRRPFSDPLPLCGAKCAAGHAGAAGRRWASSARGNTIDADAVPTLSRWPIARPPGYTLCVNMPLTPAVEEAVQRSIRRGHANGTEPRQMRTPSRLGLDSTFRPRGRPGKKPNNGLTQWRLLALGPPRLNLHGHRSRGRELRGVRERPQSARETPGHLANSRDDSVDPRPKYPNSRLPGKTARGFASGGRENPEAD
jgi:hypothetical protein